MHGRCKPLTVLYFPNSETTPKPRASPAPAPAAVDVPAPAPAPRARRPSLDEFKLAHDPDDALSEADLIRDYEEAYPEGDDVDAPAIDAAQASLAPGPLQRESEPEAVPPISLQANLASTLNPLHLAHHAAPLPKVRHALNVDSRLQMLDELAAQVAIEPAPAGDLAIWLGEKLAAAARNEGLTTLEQLAIFINENGTTWHEQINGLGEMRAARLALWLDIHSHEIGVKIRRRIMSVLAPRAAPDDALASQQSPADLALQTGGALATQDGRAKALRYALVPLDELDWPPELSGAEGAFRGPPGNGYNANTDRQAIDAWVARAVKHMALPTQEVVHRAIERLVLWALLERRKALSSLDSQDFLDFREFLYAPPAHWCGRDRVLRGSEDWRPLRGPMKPVGVRQVLVFVRQMYADWYAQGYLRLNPAHGVKHHRVKTLEDREKDKQLALEQAQAMTMNVRRSFVREDLEAMGRQLQEMQEQAFQQLLKYGPPRREDLEREVPAVARLRAILSLYIDSGLRRNEVDMLTFGTPVPVRLANELSDWMQISVVGKGDKPRDLPLRRRTLDLLNAHYRDRMRLIDKGLLPAQYRDIPYEQTPVLSIITSTRREAGKRGPGMTPADAPRRANKDGRLSASSIADILKDFFKRVGDRADLVTGQADFAAASTHWLRHTFAHRVIAETDAKLATVQKLLGHASLVTTGLYLDADMTERVRAVAQLQEVF
jgi:site-specific recombinase XerD